MSVEGQKFVPGDEATAEQVLALAHEYRRAAEQLIGLRRRGEPLSQAPYRLAATHAIELYLNAFMLARGLAAAEVRGLQHNLASRTLFARTKSLNLKKKTDEHLFELTNNREYLISRYGADAVSKWSQLNRLEATLQDVAEKVTAAVSR